MQTGYIQLKKRKYTFFFDDGILRVLPLRQGEISDVFGRLLLKETIEEKWIWGITSDLRNIGFYKCYFSPSGVGFACRPPVVVIGKNNLSNREIQYIDAIDFKGSIVDNFYPPFQIIDHFREDASERPNSINFKPFEDIHKEFECAHRGEKHKISIDIMRPQISAGMAKEVLTSPQTRLRVELSHKKRLSSIVQIYEMIQKLFAFFNFRTDIGFEDVGILVKETDNLYHQVGVMQINMARTSEAKKSNIIQLNDIEKNFSQLVKFIASDKFCYQIIPESELAEKTATPETYLSVAATLENMFDISFPNNLSATNPIYQGAKQKLKHTLREYKKAVKNQGAGSADIELLSRLDQLLSLRENTFKEKILFLLNNYSDICVEPFTRYKKASNLETVTNEEIAERYKSTRNGYAHGDFVPLTPIAVMGFQMARCFLYVLQLEQVGVEKEQIQRIIAKIF